MNFIYIFIFFLLNHAECFINRKIIYIGKKNKLYSDKLANGNYILIGPNLDNVKNINKCELLDIFMKQGKITSILISNNKFYMNIYKLKPPNCKINNHFDLAYKYLLSKINLMDDPFDISNTNLIFYNNKLYSLFEFGKPNLIEMNLQNNKILTNKKTEINTNINAHSKILNNTLITIETNILTHVNKFLLINENFEINKKINFKSKYTPVIHDFIFFENKFIYSDSPLESEFNFNDKYPLKLNEKKNTYFHVCTINSDKKNPTFDAEEYVLNKGVYIFHYAKITEQVDKYIIYAPVYFSLNFNSIFIESVYCKIILNKNDKSVRIERFDYDCRLNLDFPTVYKNYVILRNIDKNKKKTDGFVIFDNYKLVEKIIFDNIIFLGPPQISGDFLICLCIMNNIYKIFQYNFINKKIKFNKIENSVEYNPSDNNDLNFHSIFI